MHFPRNDIDLIQSIGAVPTMLDVVCRTTGMGFAAVARVTEERWIACGVWDLIGFGLEPGGELELESTICHEIRQHRQPVIINHVAEDSAYCNHHTPARYSLQSYISMPIILSDGEFFGTLCAIDPRPAQVNTPAIVGMFELFAELIAFHIEAAQRLEKSESSLREERSTADLREQFVAVLSHDLRSPLGAISSAAEILRMTAADERTAKVSGIIQDSVQRMSALIENVLDFTRGRLGDGIGLENYRRAALQPVLEQIIGEIQSSSPDCRIVTEFHLPQEVRCDPGRLGQLFSNLLGNAVAYGRKDEPVRVRATTDSESFELSVANAADLIPPAILQKLFQPFARGESNGNQQGLGLGLYIAAEIAKAHGGMLEAASDATATRFTFRMPLANK